MFRSVVIAGALLLACVRPSVAATPLLLQSPTISRTEIAFVYGGDIWTVPRDGGEARRVVTGYGIAGAPYFSPDGSTIAFSANYNGSVNVFTVPAIGGEPKQLTYHPGQDIVTGWTPDGKNIVFISGRNSPTDAYQSYEISPNGGESHVMPLPDVWGGSFSPDGTHYAYVPNGQWEPYWQGYRGGQTTPIWIANMADSSVTAIPRNNSNDRFPMWIGDTVYFVSDRNGSYTLFAYDTREKTVKQLIENHHNFDITAASANDGAIVYSQFDSLHVYDPSTHTDRAVNVTIHAEMPETRARWQPAGFQIANAGISPTGVRAVFEAHGDIFTVPVQNGNIRDITSTPSIMERDPAWSPDGRWIAYFSDAGGEYTLRLRDQKGLQPEKVFELEPRPSFYYSPTWSPDSKKILYSEKHLGIWYIDLSAEHPQAVKIDEEPFDGDGSQLDASWSPDSRYIAYSKTLPNFLHGVFAYDTQTHDRHQITDGLSDSTNPAFDRSGQYLYFLSSTNTALTAFGFDMEANGRATTASVYAATLHASTASPIAPRSDDEKVTSDEPESAPAPKPAASAAAKPAGSPAPAPIDFENIGQRIVALPIPDANYSSLQAAAPGTIFMLQGPIASLGGEPPEQTLLRFDLGSRQVIPWAEGVAGYSISADGKKMLVGKRAALGQSWSIVTTTAPPKPGEGTLATGAMEVYVDPRAEWAQMYRETWRIERDFFYDPHYHGLNIAEAEKRFSVFLPGLASRADFTYLTRQMIGYLSVGHLWVYPGPNLYGPPRVSVGLLGADYTIENGKYRIAKIYSGENWNPGLLAPLTQPGVSVKTGDYLLAVNGKPVTTDREVYAFFQETAGKQTVIRVGPNVDGSGARDVTVVPLASEANLRKLEWIAENRRMVEKLSDGKLGYVYLPDTAFGGFTNFNRYFFAQVNRDGMIVDERYNHGGQLADYVVDLLSRKPRAIIKGRDGQTIIDPPLAIEGPKVMVINQYAGSGGDALPWLFKKAGIGPLVGERTWGGLVGIGGYPSLMDGGAVMAPRVAIGGLHGQWEVEGHGVAPDIQVEQDPKLIREGHDPQLEAAVRTAMDSLREHPIPHYTPPPYPDHHPVLPPR